MTDLMMPMRNVLRREQDRDRSGPPSDSHLFAGHDQRMAYHMMRIRNHPCPCGSGDRFGDCCLGKHRCKGCGAYFLSPNENGDGRRPDWRTCPHCGSDRTVAMHLREVCG